MAKSDKGRGRVAAGRERVLFVRAEEELVSALDQVVEAEVKRGANHSRSAVIRTLLWEALRGRQQQAT